MSLKNKEKRGECIGCGQPLFILVGGALIPVTNSQYEEELSNRPDFRRHDLLKTCRLCGKGLPS